MPPGLLLRIEGGERLKERAREMNFVEGALFSEAADGTNGIGTPLAADHPLQVFASEHFNQSHHQWICSGAPVHDPVSGHIVGLVDLSSLWKIAHPGSLELVSTAARTMEQCLLDARRDQDARLRRRYSDLMTRGTDLLVNHDGYVLDGDETRHPGPIDVPTGGGEIVLDDGSVAVAESLGQGEAYLVRRQGSPGGRSVRIKSLERAERRARELASEQAALRQVATLVAREATPDQLLTVVANQAGRIFDVPLVKVVRHEPDSWVVVGGLSEGTEDPFPVSSRWPLDSQGVIGPVRQNGHSTRVQDYADMPALVAALVRRAGMRSAAASPVVVEGRLWGAIMIASPRGPLPEDAEARLTDFAELVAMAIANAESRVAVGRLADEQAALRRVAELVARQAPAEEVFGLVTDELSRLLEVNVVRTVRFEPDGTATIVAARGAADDRLTQGTNFEIPEGSAVGKVLGTGRPARVDDFAEVKGPIGAALREHGAAAGIGGPIVVGGRLWGAMAVGARNAQALPPGSEHRVAQFAELISTAISNIESRAKVERLAAEQSALRRVATLVAREHSPEAFFATLAEELGMLLDVDATAILRYEAGSNATVVAGWSGGAITLPVGARFPLEGENLAGEVRLTGKSHRKDGYGAASGEIAGTVRELGIRSAVASPIVVEGATWGVIVVLSRQPEPLPSDTETRIAEFTRQAGLGVANARSRADLADSRARIVRAGDDARRRFERDLHDGAQQRLVSLGLELRAAEASVPPELSTLRARLSQLGTGLNDVLDDLRELSRGLHPAVLSEDGLTPALSSLALRSAVPVALRLDLGTERFEDHVEVAAYYVVSEALTNTAKHAHASGAQVSAKRRGGWLELVVSDDGTGGADASSGSGLTGLADRVEAIGGSIRIESHPGRGTSIHVKLPIKSART